MIQVESKAVDTVLVVLVAKNISMTNAARCDFSFDHCRVSLTHYCRLLITNAAGVINVRLIVQCKYTANRLVEFARFFLWM